MSGIRRKKVSDLLNKKYNRLVVVEYLGVGRHKKHFWLCHCDCGGKIILPTYRITGETTTTKSCGCLRVESMRIIRHDPTTHNLHDTKLYQVFQSMKQRCYNPNSQRYMYYGGKGVKVLWEDVSEFVAWALSSGYKEGLSIDRIDSEGNYEPSNCRWITVSENTTRAHLGRTKKSIGDGAESSLQEGLLCKKEV
jgi:hypothetical protein